MLCRLSIDPPAAGAWNMAVDEVLLEWAASQSACWMRVYRWAPACLSLGYFQRAEERQSHAPSAAVPAVRRLTGGGAIVHDAELTYSLVLPAGHALAVRRDRLYAVVHGALVDALSDLAIEAARWPADRPGPAPEPFLCFLRRAPGDVVVAVTEQNPLGVKIAGSAQRRRRGAVLQHGSLLLGRSPAAPELPGLLDLFSGCVEPDELQSRWLARLQSGLGLTWERAELDASLRRVAERRATERYGCDLWTSTRMKD
jgi:lipoate-protein ligase A